MIDNYLNTDDWKTSILGNIVYSIGSGTTPKADKLDYYDNGIINWLLTGDLNDGIIKETSNKITQEAFDNSSLKIYHSGNVVIAMYGATIGKLGILDIETTTNQACCSIDCGKKLFPKFLFYFLLNEKSFIISRALGGGQPNISQATVKNLFVRYPSYYEQQTIANYLDTKCSKIDASVAVLKEMKEKYLSLKKSLINETVCRGLNKNVPLKSSGIDWIGDIPQHWEVKRFKAFAYTLKGKSTDYYDDPAEGLDVVLSLNYLRNDSVDFLDYADTSDKFQCCDVNNILIIWDGAGVGEMLRSKVGVLSSTLAKLIINERIVSKGYFWYYRNVIDYVLKNNPTGMGIPHLNPRILNNMKFPVPPIPEQQSIAKYLDDRCSKIDSIIANIDSQIEAYTKLKKSLISEVVTGKKRVI